MVTNGLLVGTPSAHDGQRTWTYPARDPMARYLVQIAIGDYEVVDAGTEQRVRIRHVFHRSLGAPVKALTARTAEMIDVLAGIYRPFPFDAYGVLAVGQPLGFAMETQTLTFIGSDIVRAGRHAEVVLLHELSHQGVGDSVRLAWWKDIWLNEGFADYSEWLWRERTEGRSAATSARRASTTDLGVPPGDPGARNLFGRTVYLRGAMTLQALRETIGDDAFVLRTWVDEHRGGSACSVDFIALAERVSGQRAR